MRPRSKWIRDVKSGQVTTEDLTGLNPTAEDKAESIRDVREMARAKIRAVHAALDDPERMLLVMVRYVRLVRKSTQTTLTAAETNWLNTVDALLARVWALRQAADDIEAQINAKVTNAEVFDHNEALATNPLWPE